MEKLRIAIVIKQGYQPTAGGGFSYYERLVEAIDNYTFYDEIDFCFLNLDDKVKYNFKKKTLTYSFAGSKNKNRGILAIRVWNRIFNLPVLKRANGRERNIQRLREFIIRDTELFLEKNKVDLLYYLVPEFIEKPVPFNYPYIITHWDLGHKSTFAFPEVSMNNEFENRDRYHRDVLNRAFAIFAESESGKKELVFYERINPERIFVVPMFAGKVVDMELDKEAQQQILTKNELVKNEFFFYPAQFWSHKNHFNLLRAFTTFVDKYPKVKLVLAGSDKGNMAYIIQVISDLELSANVICPGFVSDDTIYTFYKNAIALVMPTLLGPTNIPPLEAYELGCPVLCSNLEGHREMLGDCATYFDPFDPGDIGEKMIQVYENKPRVLIHKSSIEFTLESINNNLHKIYNYRKSFGYSVKE